MFATTTAAVAATSSRPMNAGSVASRNAVAPSNTNRALRCNHHHQMRSNVKTRKFVVSVQAEAQKTIDMNEGASSSSLFSSIETIKKTLVPSLFRDPDRVVVVVVGALFERSRVVKGNDDDGRADVDILDKPSSPLSNLLTLIAFVGALLLPQQHQQREHTDSQILLLRRERGFHAQRRKQRTFPGNLARTPTLYRENRQAARLLDRAQSDVFRRHARGEEKNPPTVRVVTTDEVWNTLLNYEWTECTKAPWKAPDQA